MIVMFRRQIIKNIIPAVIALVVFVALFFGVNALRHNAMINSIKGSLQVLFNKTENTNTRLLDSITCTDNGVVIMYDGKPYTLTMSYDNIANIGVSVFNEEQKQIIINDPDDPSLLISSDDSFPVTIKPVKYEMSGTQVACVQVNIEGHEYTFSNQLSVLGYEGSDYYYLNASGKWVKIIEAETAIFTNKPRLFSNRGYIWARSIPLLKKHIFLGSGPDTFALEFPNNDYVNSAYVGYLNQIITKPHSLYLQIGVQTGVISMLAFIAFFLIYFIRSIMLYWKHPLDTLISKLGIGISAATLGYMVSGITNDSTITYAPVFWGIIGVGIALNRLVKNEYNSRPEVKAEKAE